MFFSLDMAIFFIILFYVLFIFKHTTFSRREKIAKVGVEINEIETSKKIEEINKTKSCFLKKINKIDKYLARLRKKERRLK